jgi:hypothetical protein
MWGGPSGPPFERRESSVELLDRLQSTEHEQVVVHAQVLGLVGVFNVVFESCGADRVWQDGL